MERWKGWIEVHCANCDRYGFVGPNGLCEDCDKKLPEIEKEKFRKHRYTG